MMQARRIGLGIRGQRAYADFMDLSLWCVPPRPSQLIKSHSARRLITVAVWTRLHNTSVKTISKAAGFTSLKPTGPRP